MSFSGNLNVPIDLPRVACLSAFDTLRGMMVDYLHEVMNDGQISESLVNKALKHRIDPDCLRFSWMDNSFCREDDWHHNCMF